MSVSIHPLPPPPLHNTMHSETRPTSFTGDGSDKLVKESPCSPNQTPPTFRPDQFSKPIGGVRNVKRSLTLRPLLLLFIGHPSRRSTMAASSSSISLLYFSGYMHILHLCYNSMTKLAVFFPPPTIFWVRLCVYELILWSGLLRIFRFFWLFYVSFYVDYCFWLLHGLLLPCLCW